MLTQYHFTYVKTLSLAVLTDKLKLNETVDFAEF